MRSDGALAVPAGAVHSVVGFGDPYAGVAYLDARRYRFEDVQRLAERWRGFVPGRDDLREALGDALAIPQRRVDGRLLRAIREAALGAANLTEAAHRAGFADSAHLTRTSKQLLGVRPAEMLPRVVHVVGRLP